MALVARTERDAASFGNAIQRAIWEVDPAQPIYELSTMDQILARAVFLPRLSTTLLAMFAIAALLLAALGIYGVLSYSVSQRTKEIGLRMALGASGGNTVAMIVRSSVAMVAIGGVIGLIAATLLARSMAGILYGVGPFDLPSFALALVTLMIAGVVASLLPALRTTQGRSGGGAARTVARLAARGGHLAEEPGHFVEVDGFHEVETKPPLARQLAGAVAAVTAHRDQQLRRMRQ